MQGLIMSLNPSTGSQFDLAEWTAPVIADRIGGFYASLLQSRHLKDEDQATKLNRRHCRMWNCLLRGQHAEARACRRELLRLTASIEIEASFVDQIDRAVIDELLDVIIGRFGRSRDTAHAYGMTLVAAAASLAEARVAA
jgi:hypothetical protein